MAKVRLECGELTIGPTDDEPRSITLQPGEEVPDWALKIYNHPRAIEFEDGEEEAIYD